MADLHGTHVHLTFLDRGKLNAVDTAHVAALQSGAFVTSNMHCEYGLRPVCVQTVGLKICRSTASVTVQVSGCLLTGSLGVRLVAGVAIRADTSPTGARKPVCFRTP